MKQSGKKRTKIMKEEGPLLKPKIMKEEGPLLKPKIMKGTDLRKTKNNG